MNELIDYIIVSTILIAVGIYGLVVKRNAIRMIFAIEIIANAANINLVAFSRSVNNAQGQLFALFSIAIAAAEVAVGLGIIIIAYRLYKEIDVEEFRSMKGIVWHSSFFLMVATFLPLILSPVSYYLGRKHGVNLTTWFSFAVIAISTIMLFIPAMMLSGGKSAYVENLYMEPVWKFWLEIGWT